MGVFKYIFTFITLYFLCVSLTANDDKNYIEGNLIVQLNPESDKKLSDDIYRDLKLRLNISSLSKSNNIWLLEFDHNQIETTQLLSRLYNYDYVQIAQVNHSNIKQRNIIPNDPSFNIQWHHINGGGSGVIDADMDSDEAWEITTGGYTQNGDRIVVAVIDEGIDLDHEDLTLWTNRHEIPNNNFDDDNNGFIDDIHGYDFWNDDGNPDVVGNWEDHGTHVAGIIGAKGNNCTGVVGVNWDVDVMAIRGSSTVESEVIKAYDYVLEMRKSYNRTNGDSGAYVVATNSSFGVDRANPDNYPLWCAMYESMGLEGIISAVAGPNLNINIDNEGDVPGACPSDYTICVTNTNQSDDRAFAGYGPVNVDIGAPGSSIYSTRPPNSYTSMTGTSMATPQVAGAVALMHSAACSETLNAKNPDEMALYIKNTMLLNGIDSVDHLIGEVKSEGRLNLFKCVTAVSSSFGITTTEPTCNTNNGSISVTAYGPNTPYSYSWSTGGFTNTLTGLGSGTYMLTATDANGCTSSKSITLSDLPVINATVTDSKCKGVDNGSIDISISGADTPYSYNWSNNETTASVSGLNSGTYLLSVTGNMGCMNTASYLINDSIGKSIISTTAFQHDTCSANVGKVIVSIAPSSIYTYGTCNKSSATVYTSSPYSYNWSNGSTTDTIQQLTAGTYNLTVTTGEGCTLDSSYTINTLIPSGTIAIYDSIYHLSCKGDTDGWIRIDSITGGNTPFNYSWNNSETTSTITGLTGGNYQLTITDNLGCVAYDSFSVSEPDSLTSVITTSQMSGPNTNDGIAAANATGGTPPYTYSWSSGSMNTFINGLSPGDYTVTITDFNNCSTSRTTTIYYISGINDINDINNSDILLFPNPTTGLLMISGFRSITTINIYNQLGALIIQSNNNTEIDLSQQPDCIYFIELKDGEGNLFRKKVIKY